MAARQDLRSRPSVQIDTENFFTRAGSDREGLGGNSELGDPQLLERIERLMTIPAVGPITALTWALEVGHVKRFSSIMKAISYCGLCGAEKSSGNTTQRTPLSKQRNKHLQTTLIEAAKMAPRNSTSLALLYDTEKRKGNANRATLAVACKLVAYLVAVDRRQKEFLIAEGENRTAA
jgi:transposase